MMICRKIGCVISFFYIKPQQKGEQVTFNLVVLYLSSTSNHNQSFPLNFSDLVVLYLSSTSNHNRGQELELFKQVVLYLSSTSNHNQSFPLNFSDLLCYIFLLHQTTTGLAFITPLKQLCYIFLLHQTTTQRCSTMQRCCCVISFFYIKPQPLYWTDRSAFRCVISFFYIKPQPSFATRPICQVVLYLSSTSNHNQSTTRNRISLLCYIFLLHQTTTAGAALAYFMCCVISFFYIKPQLFANDPEWNVGCVISLFYIKPQPYQMRL